MSITSMLETKNLIQIPDNIDLKQYFSNCGLSVVLHDSDRPDREVNEIQTELPCKPELDDLYRLHRLIIDFRRITVLEFGSGYSSLVIANALAFNASMYGAEIQKLRRNNPFELHSVDNSEKYIAIASNRIPSQLRKHVNFHYSSVSMGHFNARICTFYDHLPLVNPDLIYLDGPDQFNVHGEIAGWSTRHNDMMPMSADILRIEHFLTPGTIIIVDGRSANARFLKCNLQRDWLYEHDDLYDQHIFKLNEPALGKYNQKQLDFYDGYDLDKV